ncbi:MAG: PfkB family carbohydrate kinase [Thermoleophilia bacterium]
MSVAVVGHVEWVEFVRVERLPQQGEILQAGETWAEAAGGGGVAAVQLARLAGESTLYCALGDDAIGHRAKAELEALGVRVEAAWRPAPQRRGITFLDARHERTIVVIGEKHHPRRDDPLDWDALATAEAVYLTAGEPDAIQAARRAGVLVSTARELPILQRAGVELDALVASGEDAGERYAPGDLDPPPRLVVTTSGALGGWMQPGGPYAAAPLPGPVEDAYGAGDSFAAGLTYGLGRGWPADEAVALAARLGAEALTRRGAHGGGPATGPP